MTLIEILLLLVAIGAGFFAYLKMEKSKGLKKQVDSNESLIKIKDETIDFQKKNYIELKEAIDSSNKSEQEQIEKVLELQSLYDNAKDEIRQHLEKIKELSYEVETSYREPSNQPVLLKNINVDIDYLGHITWTTLEINIAILIADNKLFDVFKKLLNSKLLPESIQEQIDFQKDDLSVVIWCQNFDPDGNPTKSLTWFEIIQQIINKKRIITDYLNGVIQESNRAMVVHQALSEKPRKEVASA